MDARGVEHGAIACPSDGGGISEQETLCRLAAAKVCGLGKVFSAVLCGKKLLVVMSKASAADGDDHDTAIRRDNVCTYFLVRVRHAESGIPA